MLVKELKQLLSEVPDDLRVIVMVENHIKPGMFAFAEACTCDTGVSTLANEDGTPDGETVFLVLPHGLGISEDDIENGKDTVPELN